MKIIERENGILLQEAEYFDAQAVFECGQVFRYQKAGDGKYVIISQDKRAAVTQNGTDVLIETTDKEYFSQYFDLNRDYSVFGDYAKRHPVLSEAFKYGKGIRILRQNIEETVFSFIISANNHIPRIRGIIERLSAAFGKDCGGYFAFPDSKALALQSEETFRELGLGYRASYIRETAAMIADGFDLETLKQLPSAEARKKLLSLKGVGGKVADCILLFAYGRLDVCPVDTWMEQVYHRYFEAGHQRREIANYFAELFGNYAGIMQQYLFYFQRSFA